MYRVKIWWRRSWQIRWRMCLNKRTSRSSLAGTVEEERSQPPLFPEAETTRPAAKTDCACGRPGRAAGCPEAAVSAISVKIVADESTNSLLIRSTARDYRQLLTTISQLDVVPLQVMVNAVIAQITLNDENRFGVD